MTSTAADEQDNPRWILVADDEPSVRQFVERALNYAGFAVTAVPDGNAALAALEKRAYDLLLTDIVMPDLDGIALALKVSKDYPKTRILMMSGYANQRQRAHNLDCLAHEVISKPFTLEEITRRITTALAA
ncbi:MAG TPA: response regulator [Alphaproteobacteria bacterium]|nr:response regulator [Alphaproteobacteria bacterium]HCS22330.1 response regulator [Rhodospirillaceae bacterium]HRI76091.1 response regulator [Alphaproteobacteria bacterium]HRJ65806.1 response regulator [Alphaproteobacteria bacterium]